MSGLRLPRAQAELPQGGGDQGPFPAGTYLFELIPAEKDGEDRRISVLTQDTMRNNEKLTWMYTSPKWDPEGPAFASGDLTQLNLWLQTREVLEGENDPKDRIHFQSIIVQDGAIGIDEVDLENPNGEGTGIIKDAPLWVGLNDVLGVTEVVGVTDDGDEIISPAANARNLHEAGAFDNQMIIAEIVHNRAGTRAFVRRFEAVAS